MARLLKFFPEFSYFFEFGQTPVSDYEKRALIPSLKTLEELNFWGHENIV